MRYKFILSKSKMILSKSKIFVIISTLCQHSYPKNPKWLKIAIIGHIWNVSKFIKAKIISVSQD